MAGSLSDFKIMTSLEYHKKQLAYNMSACIAEIKRVYPDDINPNPSDEKYRELISKLPFKPMMDGGIIKHLGLGEELLTLDMWEDFSAGWARADKIPEDSPLFNQIVDTPRGKLVQLNKSALKIDETGNYILPKKGQEKKRRLGTEMLFGMGQNLSTKLALMEIEDPEVGHRFSKIAKRVFHEKILPELTKDALIRTGKDGAVVVRAAELMTVCFEHPENRSENPFRHFHFDLMNTALGEDGKLYALSNDQIIKNKDKYSAIFMSSMMEELQLEFGFKFKKVFLKEDGENEFLEDKDRNVASYDLIDEFVPAQVQDYMQARTNEIENYLKEQGRELSFIEKEHARLETRKEKTDLSHHELKEKWAKDFERLDYKFGHGDEHLEFNPKKAQPTLPDGRLLNDHEEASLIENFLRKHKDISFTEDQFKAHVIKQLIGDYAFKDVEREAERIFSTQCLQMLSKEQLDFYRPLLEDTLTDPMERQQLQIKYARDLSFTFKSVRQKDMDIVDAFKRNQHDTRFVFDKNEVEQFIYEFEAKKTEEFRKKNPNAKPFKFATGGKNADPNKPEGQRQAIIDALTKEGLGWVVKGRAGAGKSTLVEAVKQFYEKKGISMYGTSTSSTATEGLAESIGLKNGKFANATQLLKLLEKNPNLLNDKSCVCMDEAGMSDLSTMHKLVMHCDRVGARLLLVGEAEQLQAVGYGDAFRYIGEKFGLTEVKDINRQVDDWQREMVEDFASGRAHKAVKTLYDNGSVVLAKTDAERLEQMVHDYVYMTEKYEKVNREFKNGKITSTTEIAEKGVKFKDKLAIATTNADVEKVNRAIRAELKKAGLLTSNPDEEVKVNCKDGVERDFCIGDRILFSRKTKTDDADPLNVNNSTTGTLTAFKLGKNNKPVAMKILTDQGREVWLNVNKKLAIRHGFCSTVHKSQGQTKTKALYYVSSTMNSLHLAYVAMSRHRTQAKMYLSEEMAQALVDKMEDREPTELMKKISKEIAQKHGYELNAEQLNSFKELRIFLNEHHSRLDDTKAKNDPTRHPMDDYTSIVESMARTNFKKSTFDFEILDGKQVNIYNSIKAEKELVREIKPEVKVEVPVEEVKPEIKVEPIKPDEQAPEVTIDNRLKNVKIKKKITKGKKL